ncbi:glutathione S-transferase theta-3-like [Sycon ciliatum]|uniref:glutathione S-transferase theta-3-like n=1 Tax=Sycon ciliatum TaxID=27933 RepID=UPI0031F6F069
MSNSEVVEIFVSPFSQPARAVWWFCKLQNVPHEFKPIQLGQGDHKTAEYKAINYFQRVPALRCGSFTLSESGAILTFLSRKYGAGTDWWPEDLEVAGRVAEYIAWHCGAAGLQAAGVGWVFPSVFASQRDDALIADRRVDFHKALDVLEQYFLARNTAYIATEHLTVADLLAAPEVAQIHMIDDATFTLDKHPKVKAWFERMRALPDYQSIHEQVLQRKKIDF